MIGSKLAITTQENGLEVIADSSLNISTECLVAVKTANRMLGEIRNGIRNKTESIGMPVHKSTVCLYLEAPITSSQKCKMELKTYEGVRSTWLGERNGSRNKLLLVLKQ